MEKLCIQRDELVAQLDELGQSISKTNSAIASCEKGIRDIMNHFYATGFWARPKRSKCIKRLNK